MTYSQRRLQAKTSAKEALKGHWGKSIAVWLLLLAVIAGITLLSLGTLFAANPQDFDIAVSPMGLHSYGLPSNEELGLLAQQAEQFFNTFTQTGELDFNIFTIPTIAHTSPLGTAIIMGFSILISVMTLVMTFGIAKYYLSLIERNNPSISLIFSYFGSAKKFFGSILFTILITVIFSLWGLLFGLVWFIVFTIASVALIVSLISGSAAGLIVFGVVYLLFIAATFAFDIFLFRYIASPFLFIKTGGILSSIKTSKTVMKKHKWEYFVFLLSFIGWFLLSALTCGILLIYVLPYYTAANTAFINGLIEGDGPAAGNGDEPMPEIPNFTEFLS